MAKTLICKNLEGDFYPTPIKVLYFSELAEYERIGVVLMVELFILLMVLDCKNREVFSEKQSMNLSCLLQDLLDFLAIHPHSQSYLFNRQPDFV